MTNRRKKSEPWDCVDVRRHLAQGSRPLTHQAWLTKTAHLEACDDCRRAVDDYYRRTAPEWVKAWLRGEESAAEALRRHAAVNVTHVTSSSTSRVIPGAIEGIEILGLAAASDYLAPNEKGRRFLRRGRHEVRLKSARRRAVVLLEESEGRLWIRWISGSRLKLRTRADVLGDRFEAVPNEGVGSLLDVLNAQLQWSQ
jgi:hypothetical protein